MNRVTGGFLGQLGQERRVAHLMPYATKQTLKFNHFKSHLVMEWSVLIEPIGRREVDTWAFINSKRRWHKSSPRFKKQVLRAMRKNVMEQVQTFIDQYNDAYNDALRSAR